MREGVERLLAGSASGEEFGRRYLPYLNDDPEVTMSHAAVRQAIALWPRLGDIDEAQLLHQRHRLTELVRHHRPRRAD